LISLPQTVMAGLAQTCSGQPRFLGWRSESKT
jgi:hypothetical protein